jgi:hypothetical protein
MSNSKQLPSEKILYRVFHFYSIDWKIHKYRVLEEKERSIFVERLSDGDRTMIFTGPNPINAIGSGWWETEDDARKHLSSMARRQLDKNIAQNEFLTKILRFSSEDIEIT